MFLYADAAVDDGDCAVGGDGNETGGVSSTYANIYCFHPPTYVHI